MHTGDTFEDLGHNGHEQSPPSVETATTPENSMKHDKEALVGQIGDTAQGAEDDTDGTLSTDHEAVQEDNVYKVEDEANTQSSEEARKIPEEALVDTSSKADVSGQPKNHPEEPVKENVPLPEGSRDESIYAAEDDANTAPSTKSDEQAAQTARMASNPSGDEPEVPAQQSASIEKERVRSPSPPPLPPKDTKFLNLNIAGSTAGKQSSEPEYDEKHPPEDDTVADAQPGGNDASEDSKSEIQSIMEQFENGTGGELDEIMSPRLEMAPPIFHPPRSSSLEPIQPGSSSPKPSLYRTGSRESYTFSPSAIRPPSISGASISSQQQAHRDSITSPQPSNSSMFQPPPPAPDPEPSLPFDFHRFLEQLRHRTADPVARFLRSFLTEFGKKQWMVHEQVKIISDFLEFISKKMAQCEVWRTVSDAEFDNAREGMEKLVMNRLYNQTFSPAIPPPEPVAPAKGRKGRAAATSPHGSGRRGQHQEDVERDAVIAQKLRIYGWIKEEHLDMAPVGEKGRKFLLLAQQELLKINSYRAPRDKVICILNSCKVLFGFLRNSKSDQSADAFVPLLIYTVIKANPDHLVSNVQYITRFRNQDKLGGEAGYYISSLMGVISFVENLDRTNLTISDDEFERNVEAAVSTIAEGHRKDEYEAQTHAAPAPRLQEKSSLSRPEVTPRNSMEAERASPRRTASNREKGPSEEGEENAAVAGLLRTIQKPLSTIGRIFSDEGPSQGSSQSPHPALTPQPGSTPRLSPAPNLPRRPSEETRRRSPVRRESADMIRGPEPRMSAEDAAARQASAEAAEAQRIRAQEHRVVVESVFPYIRAVRYLLTCCIGHFRACFLTLIGTSSAMWFA
ncbi:hypothetical protein M8818_006899 [Zalaria obscura]|uniref:Uncharacterized protein n=1 Tax=Zalaria obscura TaxID=2024903 RepID=A0ACC3S732_9PEZI